MKVSNRNALTSLAMRDGALSCMKVRIGNAFLFCNEVPEFCMDTESGLLSDVESTVQESPLISQLQEQDIPHRCLTC